MFFAVAHTPILSFVRTFSEGSFAFSHYIQYNYGHRIKMSIGLAALVK